MTTKLIPLKSIDVPPGNRDSIDPVKLQGLADTMRESGQLAAVIVRPAAKKGRFELIAGERRLRAAELLKWKEIEAKEVQADDGRARELHAIENLQREDLTPWEEARKLAELAGSNRHAIRVEELAARLGRSSQWVAVRLAVNKLIPELRQLVIEQDWPLTHLPLLARIPPAAQPTILDAIRETQEMDWGYWDEANRRNVPTYPSRGQLEEFLLEYTRLLSQAPWALDDAFLTDAGSCDQCAKRTGAQALLFPELAADAKKTDRCLDEGCWKTKQAALIKLNVEKVARETKAKPILLQAGYERPSEELQEALGSGKVERAEGYSECKKTDSGAKPAILVTGDQAGKLKYVKPAENGRGNAGKEPKRPVSQDTGEPEPPSTEERLRVLELKRKCRSAELWSEKLETLKPKWVGMLDVLILHFGCDSRREHRDERDWLEFDSRDRKAKLEQIAWEQLYPIFQKRLTRFGSMEQQGDDVWEECVHQARALGLLSILQLIWNDVCVEIPLTKALAVDGVKDPGPKFKEAIK